MEEIFKFTLSGFWIFVGSYLIIWLILYFLINGIMRIASRFFRMLMVLLRGWPPNHLDADGDFKFPSNN